MEKRYLRRLMKERKNSVKLQQLRYALVISKYGSFNKAAKKLFISQPTLSTAIKELEKEINISIFERTTKGVRPSREGIEFLGYARQIIEQTELLEERYINFKPSVRQLSISTQHYAFVVNAFVDLIKNYQLDQYEFNLRETKTYEIIDDVRNLRSEIGILYKNQFNEKVLSKLFKDYSLEFHELFTVKPYVFISKSNPLAKKEIIKLEELEDYPCLSFEQGEYNSFYFSEEILSTISHKKSINVNDRATLFNLLIGINGYTISTGIISEDLNGPNIIAVPIESEETITVGWINQRNVKLTQLAIEYINILENITRKYVQEL